MHENVLTEPNVQLFGNIDLFLRYPVAPKSSLPDLNNLRKKIFKDFFDLNQKQDLLNLFGNLLFDPGINREIKISDELAKRLNEVDPGFYMSYRDPIKILTRRSLLRLSSSEIINNKNVAFVNFDIKDLRLADQIGYGDILLNDFSRVLEIIRAKHKEKFDLIPGRVGGDEFCFFLSSSTKISKAELVKIYQEVKEEWAKKTGYYKNVVGQDITKRSPELKTVGNIEDQIVIANDDQSKRMFLSRSLIKGRIPNSEQLKNAKNVSKEEFALAKSESAQKFIFHSDLIAVSFRKKIEGFINRHPEFIKQGIVLNELINKNKMYLANYLFDMLGDSLKDPLINDEIYTFAGLADHLQSRESKADEKIVHFYNPWLKVLNGDIGYDNTDDVIEKSYYEIIRQLEESGYKRNIMTISRRGGDFTLTMNRYKSGLIILDCGSSLPKDHIFSKGIPVFLSTVPYPKKGESVDTFIQNVERESKTVFVRWLNNEFLTNKKKAKKYIDYYLRERTLDRARDLLEQFTYIKGLSKDLKQYVEDVIKNFQEQPKN